MIALKVAISPKTCCCWCLQSRHVLQRNPNTSQPNTLLTSEREEWPLVVSPQCTLHGEAGFCSSLVTKGSRAQAQQMKEGGDKVLDGIIIHICSSTQSRYHTVKHNCLTTCSSPQSCNNCCMWAFSSLSYMWDLSGMFAAIAFFFFNLEQSSTCGPCRIW